MRPFDKLVNLLVMAVSDGSINDQELKFLLNRSARWGISKEQLSLAVQYAASEDAELRIPRERRESTAMLEDLIRMMAADGQLDEIEKRLFATAAAKLNVSREELDKIIDEATRTQASDLSETG
jgi:uncharacterized tellurite resistance protein B-like protein